MSILGHWVEVDFDQDTEKSRFSGEENVFFMILVGI